jgi:hypothetical protein
MKKNIIICCESMMTALVHGVVQLGTGAEVTLTNLGRWAYITHCPWCGKVLPLPSEESE